MPPIPSETIPNSSEIEIPEEIKIPKVEETQQKSSVDEKTSPFESDSSDSSDSSSSSTSSTSSNTPTTPSKSESTENKKKESKPESPVSASRAKFVLHFTDTSDSSDSDSEHSSVTPKKDNGKSTEQSTEQPAEQQPIHVLPTPLALDSSDSSDESDDLYDKLYHVFVDKFDFVNYKNITFLANARCIELLDDDLQNSYNESDINDGIWVKSLTLLKTIVDKFSIFYLYNESAKTIRIVYYKAINNITLVCDIDI